MIAYKQLAKLSICLAIVVLISCSSNRDADLLRYIKTIKERKAAPIAPIPKSNQLVKFMYPENETRRSPFKQKVLQQDIDALAPNTKRPKEPLEAYPLDALKFVGMIEEGKQIWALISLPSEEIRRVKIGNYLGQNFGQIVAIDKNSLKIEETLQVLGKWQKKATIFTLNNSK